MVSTVALILKMNSAALFIGLAQSMPVWVADSAENEPLKNLIPKQEEILSVTWFPIRQDEQLFDAGMRICYSLDDHYNEDAQLGHGYKTLLVFGGGYSDAANQKLEELGFRQAESTEFGFVATKNKF